MNAIQAVLEAMSSLTMNKLRSGLTILGIVIGVAAVISMLAIGRGAQNQITSSISGMGTNLLTVQSGNFTAKVFNAQPLTTGDVTALQNQSAAPDIAAVGATVSSRFTVSTGGKSSTTQVSGVMPQNAQISNDTVSEGTYITEQQEQSRMSVAVIGQTTATNLFGATTGLVGKTIRINGQIFTVVGVLASKGGTSLGNEDDRVLIPLTTAQIRLIQRNPSNAVDQILVSAKSASSISAAEDEITAILRAEHKIKASGKNDFSILAQSTLVSAASSITGTLTMFLGGIAGISLLVGGIGIMNIMLVSVTERTREIGLRKALGARKLDILVQFLTESMLLSLIGGLIGIALAWVITLVISKVAAASGTTLSPSIGLDSIILATLFSSAVGLLFGLYPSNRAASLQPVEALRYE
ncbi:MAG: ABC transporter permease [Chloroflexi bacterium]|nr:ABC transporter permease [Chloroflexota bacterium]